jgi:hypothetical protein
MEYVKLNLEYDTPNVVICKKIVAQIFELIFPKSSLNKKSP